MICHSGSTQHREIGFGTMQPRLAYYVYLLASRKGGVPYLDVTNNLVRRVHEHKTKATSGFTSRYLSPRLVRDLRRRMHGYQSEKGHQKMATRLENRVDRSDQSRMGRSLRLDHGVAAGFRVHASGLPRNDDPIFPCHSGVARRARPGISSISEACRSSQPQAVAARSRRSAAARASAVISAPASMRAISSRRGSLASAATRVVTRLPLSSVSLVMSRC
jgi:hypothetical protein